MQISDFRNAWKILAAMDFLSLFDDEPGPQPDQQQVQQQQVEQQQHQVQQQLQQHQVQQQLQQHGMQLERSADASAVVVAAPAEEKVGRRKRAFYNSRGSNVERKAWNLDMQLRRAKKKAVRNENDILNVLAAFKKRSIIDGTVVLHRTKSTKKGNLFSRAGLVKVSYLKMTVRGNRFASKWAMSDFLAVSFGQDTSKGKRILARNSQALAKQMAPSTVATMRAVTAGATMAKEFSFLARLLILCRANPPQVVGLREAFDETGQIITVSRERATWQICVVRHTLLLLWPETDGKRKIIKVPVATLLSNGKVALTD